jgi:hypothetical protein
MHAENIYEPNTKYYFMNFSFYLWFYRPLALGRFFSFLILYTVGRTP